MTIIILKLILFTSIWTLGLTIATQENMIFYRFREYAESKTAWIWQPIIICHWCMPSIHALFGYAFAYGLGILDHFEWKYLIMYPLVVMGSSTFCGIIWTWYLKAEQETLYYRSGEGHYELLSQKMREKYFPKQENQPNGES